MLLKLLFNIYLYLVLINYCAAQERKFNAGVNLAGILFNSLDIAVDYHITSNRTISLNFGRQFNKKVPELSNSENSNASGNFLRLGITFVSDNEKVTKIYFKPEILFTLLEHHATTFYTSTYERFTLPFDYEKTYWGFMLGAGILSRLEKWEFMGGFSIGSTIDIKPFMLDGYTLPGYGNGIAIERFKKSTIFVKPDIFIKYRFGS